MEERMPSLQHHMLKTKTSGHLFFFNKTTHESTLQRQRNSDENQDGARAGSNSNEGAVEEEIEENIIEEEVLEETDTESVQDVVIQDETAETSRKIREEDEKETGEEAYSGPPIISIDDIEILTPLEDIVFDFATDKV